MLTVDNLAGGDITKWNEITDKMTAIEVYTKLSMEFDRALFKKQLGEIRERNRKIAELANKS